MGYVAFVLHAAAIMTSTHSRPDKLDLLRDLVFVCRHMAGFHVEVHCFYFDKDMALEGGAWQCAVCGDGAGVWVCSSRRCSSARCHVSSRSRRSRARVDGRAADK